MTTAATTTVTAASPCAQIPIWVGGKQLWISGVDRRTTVDEIVETLLGHPDKQYSITEKWRQVERPLNGDTRVLKLWKTWGNAKAEVKLSLKKIQADEKNSEKNTLINFTKKKTRCYKSVCSKYGQTIHPKRLAELSKTHGIERLLKLILVQGETIQNQIGKLKNRQFEIEQLENEQLKLRINSLGTKYLVNAYLGTNEDKDSGRNNETIIETAKDDNDYDDDDDDDDNNNNNNSEHDDDENRPDHYDEEITIEQNIETEIEELRNKIYFLDKIVKINKKLEKEEEHLVRLFINIERCKEDESWAATTTTTTTTTKTTDELDLHFDLNRLKNENEKSETEFDNNCKLLTRVENSILSRRYYLKRLHDDFYDEMNQHSDHDLQSIASCSVRSLTRSALPYYAAKTATTTSISKPVLNTLV